MKLKVVIEEDKEVGGYVVSCSALPGCHSDTIEEASLAGGHPPNS